MDDGGAEGGLAFHRAVSFLSAESHPSPTDTLRVLQGGGGEFKGGSLQGGGIQGGIGESAIMISQEIRVRSILGVGSATWRYSHALAWAIFRRQNRCTT